MVINSLLIRAFAWLSMFVLFSGLNVSDNSKHIQDKEQFDPKAIFLTLQNDPATTMTIDWHTAPGGESRESVLQYKIRGEKKWNEVNADTHNFPYSDYKIHRIELKNLEPDAAYDFRFGADSKAYYFKTMPLKLSRSVRFAEGGDVYGLNDFGRFEKMNKVVMESKPDFIVWGGDLAAGNGDPLRVGRWYDFFSIIKETLIYEDGQVIPIICAIGNHEIFSRQRLIWGRSPHNEHTEEEADAYMEKNNLSNGQATYFFDLFAFPGKPAYNVLDFGDYLSLLILDSNHTSPVRGEQTNWLKKVLTERKNHPHIFPVYHVPAYPSAGSYNGQTQIDIRENWIPLFEKFNVRTAFEHHKHGYKRTHPIKNEKIDEDGIVYIGDGGWASFNLQTNGPESYNINEYPWYIKKYVVMNTANIITLKATEQIIKTVNMEGEIIDSLTNSIK